jgi:hypothetical protein
MSRLQLLELPVQTVVFQIRDGRRRQDIIGPVVGEDFPCQLGMADLGRLAGNVGHGVRLNERPRALKPNEASDECSNPFKNTDQNRPEDLNL